MELRRRTGCSRCRPSMSERKQVIASSRSEMSKPNSRASIHAFRNRRLHRWPSTCRRMVVPRSCERATLRADSRLWNCHCPFGPKPCRCSARFCRRTLGLPIDHFDSESLARGPNATEPIGRIGNWNFFDVSTARGCRSLVWLSLFSGRLQPSRRSSSEWGCWRWAIVNSVGRSTAQADGVDRSWAVDVARGWGCGRHES